MKVGLVTITYNSQEVLPDFLESVQKQTYTNYMLYIIDNNSADQSLEIIQKLSKDKTHIIANKANLGVASGNNQGIKRALKDGCEYVLLINNDTIFEASLLEKLVSFSHLEKADVVAPKMLYYDNPEIIWYAGGGLDKRKAYAPFHRGMGEVDKGQYSGIDKLDYSPTCCVLFRKKVFEDVGLMDEKYFVYFDDVDFFYRILKLGIHKCIYVDDFYFLHKEGSLTNAKEGTIDNFFFSDFSIIQLTKNRVYYLKKMKNVYAYFYIIFFYFRLQVRFFISGKYRRNIATYFLLNKSYFEGIKL